MLINQIKDDLTKAQKSQDSSTVSTLRFLISEINNFASAKYPPSSGGIPSTGLPDEDILSVLQKQVKTHNESITAFKDGNRSDLVEKEQAELEILQKYLPARMDEEEIKKVVEAVIAAGEKDFGKVMRKTMSQLKGKADGGTVSKIVKECLIS